MFSRLFLAQMTVVKKVYYNYPKEKFAALLKKQVQKIKNMTRSKVKMGGKSMKPLQVLYHHKKENGN